MNYSELKTSKLSEPLYVLVGDAEICEMAKRDIISSLNINEMSISLFDDENFDAMAVINSANQFSFFDDKRLVIIKNLSRELVKSEQELFLNYLKNPNQNAIVLINNYQSLSNFDFIKKKEIIECKVEGGFVLNFIKNEFLKNGKQIDPSTANKLAGNCLNNLTRIKLEIKKICDYLLDNNVVSDEIIDLLVAPDVEMRVFDLTDSLANKNIQGANKILYDMIMAGESPIKIMGLIASHFRRLFFAKINSNFKTNELANALGCKEYAVVKAKQQAQKFGANQLKKIENLILKVDYAMKSGGMSQENGLYYLVYNIAIM